MTAGSSADGEAQWSARACGRRRTDGVLAFGWAWRTRQPFFSAGDAKVPRPGQSFGRLPLLRDGLPCTLRCSRPHVEPQKVAAVGLRDALACSVVGWLHVSRLQLDWCLQDREFVTCTEGLKCLRSMGGLWPAQHGLAGT